MMKKKVFLAAGFFIVFAGLLQAQIQRHKIAIFTPLYLDSVFDAAGNFKYDKNPFPRFVSAGLEFYQGTKAALDSLQKRGAPLDVFVYDSRGTQPISQLINKPEWKDMEMLLAQTNSGETKLLAEAALRKKIPFISATLPNDAGVSNNPYFVILNSTLQAHVEGIYRFLQKNHSHDNIVVFTKPGSQEDQLKENFAEFTKSTVSGPLKIKYVNIGSNFTPEIVAAHLDSNKKNICISGTLDENFGMKLLQKLAALNSTYPIRVIGMPTWEKINFNRPDLSNLEVIYTTPFYYNRMSPLEIKLGEEYATKFSTKPGEMFFRGYETMLRFGLLLLDTKKDVSSNLTRKGNYVFTPFDIQPVFKDKSSMTLDYFENKHLYFVKVFGGVKYILQ